RYGWRLGCGRGAAHGSSAEWDRLALGSRTAQGSAYDSDAEWDRLPAPVHIQLGQSARLREETATGADAEEKLHTAARLRRTIG
ncbi:hypothetical protein Csa_010896, partial [Cucumis sativus]